MYGTLLWEITTNLTRNVLVHNDLPTSSKGTGDILSFVAIFLVKGVNPKLYQEGFRALFALLFSDRGLKISRSYLAWEWNKDNVGSLYVYVDERGLFHEY